MRSVQSEAMLESTRGEVIVLEEVGIDAAVDDLMTVVTVQQRYRNPGAAHVEAVYTFPLPLDGVLLALSVSLGDRNLVGTVLGKSEAEQRYEDAVTDGDAAVLLEQAQPGLYTANVGNLAPGEVATVRFRFGLLLRWNGDRVRLLLPTTIAPRYGDPAAGGLSPHQSPDFSIDAERAFSLRVAVRGALKDARFNSPSHAVVVTPGSERTTIELAADAAMDRDFVLEARSSRSARSDAAEALLAPDGDGWVVLASVCPDIPDFATDERRCIKIVVDCSGSMNGDSIAQVRVAAERILDSLRTGDQFEFIAFGSGRCTLFGRTMPASEENLARARGFVRRLTADMGGTEIGDALAAAYRTPDDAGASRDLLLITDGEVWDTGSVFAAARASGHRIFTVGVGSAVAESFVRALAAETGGSCELVAPREDMAERIHRHFQRIVAPRARTARVRWPAPVQHRMPQHLPPLYGGDTVHLFAWFADKPHGDVVLDLQLSDGRSINQRLQINPVPHAAVADQRVPSDLARLGAARRLGDMRGKAEATELAVRYQLLSEWTNYLVIHVRADAEKSDGLPILAKVPQVLAAGWHGIGTVHAAAVRHSLHDLSERADSAGPPDDRAHRLARMSPDAVRAELPPRSKTAPRTRRASTARAHGTTLMEFVSAINAWPLPPTPSLDDLHARGIPVTIIRRLEALIDVGEDARAVIDAFLYLVCNSEAGLSLDRPQRRRLLRAYKDLSEPSVAARKVRNIWRTWSGVK